MNSQPWAPSPSVEIGPKLYHGSQNEIKRTKVAGPTTQCLPLSALSRCRDFLTRLGGGRGTTGRLMAAPHLGQSAVPGDTSIRQREQAGKSATLLPAVTDVSAQATSRGGLDLSMGGSHSGRGASIPVPRTRQLAGRCA